MKSPLNKQNELTSFSRAFRNYSACMFVQALVEATNFTPLFANSDIDGLYSFASYMVPQFPQVISFLEIVSID